MEAAPPNYERGPDPTTATTAQTLREVSHLREVITLALADVETRIDGIERQITSQLEDIRKANEAAFVSANAAISKAEVATEKRFDSVNEFRQTLADQSSTFMPRTESMSRHAATAEKLAALDTAIGKVEIDGKTLAAVVVRRDDLTPINATIDSLRNRLSETSGKEAASTRIVSVGLTVFAIVVTITFGVWAISDRASSKPDPTEAVQTKRIDDMVARLDSLSNRLNQQMAPRP